MNAIRFPDGKLVNIDQVRDFSISGSDVVATFPDTTTYSYTTASSDDAEAMLKQIMAALGGGSGVTEVYRLPVTRSITSVTPNTTAMAANDSLTIAGTNMIDQSMIDAGQLLVKINGNICGVVSATPSSIVVIDATQTVTGIAIVEIYQSVYGVGDNLLCQDASLLTIT